jgi:hypothetical protein
LFALFLNKFEKKGDILRMSPFAFAPYALNHAPCASFHLLNHLKELLIFLTILALNIPMNTSRKSTNPLPI